MIALSLLFLNALGSVPETWYGPVEVSFHIPYEGSPYDAKNDVRVVFKNGNESEERLAFFRDGSWHAILLAKKPGTYSEIITRNGAQIVNVKATIKVSRPYTHTFARLSPDHRGFVSSSGEPIWPLGHNLAWGGGRMPPLTDMIKTMGQNRMNWARIWSSAWDGKNPWWPEEGTRMPLLDLNQKAFSRWDKIFDAAEESGVRFQWVLFHHGPFSTEVDPNWPQSPWNVANGGFLKNPIEFFSNSMAKRLTKNYLRYVVARYGHESSVFAWELFNEVENTDAMRKGHQVEVEAWHQEMADYVRGIDPYHHLITTSSQTGHGLTKAVDYYQPHGYPSNVQSMILAAKVLTDKPFFFGEVGLGGATPTPAEQRRTVRDAIYGGLLAGHAGAGQYWYWDAVQNLKLDSEFLHGAQVIDLLGVLPGETLVPVVASTETVQKSDMVILPGISWGPSQKFTFHLPEEGDDRNVGKMSSFLQGSNHTDMGSEFRFEFTAKSAGDASIAVGTISGTGGILVCNLDGRIVARRPLPGNGKDAPSDLVVHIPYSAGHHVVIFKNEGVDWLNIKQYRFSGLGPAASVAIASQKGHLFGRLQKFAEGAVDLKLLNLPLPDGTYQMKLFDLDDGLKPSLVNVEVKGGKFTSNVSVGLADSIFEVTPVK